MWVVGKLYQQFYPMHCYSIHSFLDSLLHNKVSDDWKGRELALTGAKMGLLLTVCMVLSR